MSNAEPASPAADLSWRPTYDPSQSELTFFGQKNIHQSECCKTEKCKFKSLAPYGRDLPVQSRTRVPF